MNLVVLYMLILVTQLSLFTYGKSSPVADHHEIVSSQLSNNGSDLDTENNVDGLLMNENYGMFERKLFDELKKCSW